MINFLLWVLLLSLVLGRLFTETLGVVPRAVNFADLGLLVVFAVLLCLGYASGKSRFRHAGLLVPLLGFVLIGIISTTLNNLLFDNPLRAALASMVFYLEPILFAWIFVNLGWRQQNTRTLQALLVGLGLVQIPFGLYQIPRAIQVANADVVAGTFGANGSQMCFLLLLAGGYMIGRFAIERRWRWLLPIPPMLVIFYASGFKIMWVLLPVTIVLVVWILLPLRFWEKAGLILGFALLSALFIFTVGRFASARTFGFFSDFFSPELLKLGKIQSFVNIGQLYQEVPHASWIGVGLGGYAGRGVQTFAQFSTEMDSSTSPTVGYVSTLAMPVWTAQYIAPLYGKRVALFGSYTIDGPFTSYVALLGEVGLLGFGCYMALYGLIYAKVRQASRAAWRARDAGMFGLTIAGMLGMFFLLQMALFDNWLEVARATVLLWVVFIPFLARPMPEAATREVPQGVDVPRPVGLKQAV